MNRTKKTKEALLPTPADAFKKIEEAAYFGWLNRGRNAQAGDELNDWITAEKDSKDCLTAMRSGELYQLRGEIVS